MSNKEVKSISTSDLDFENLIKVYKKFSRSVAILPFEGRNFNYIGTRILTIVNVFATIMATSMFVGYNIDTLIRKKPINIADVYTPLLSIGSYIRYYLLLRSRKKNVDLFEESRQLWEFGNYKGRATIKLYENKIRLIYTIYVCSFFMANILIPVDAYMARLPASDPNGTEQRVLPFRWFVDDEPYKYLGYHTTFIIEVIVIQICILIGVAVDGTLPGHVMLAAAYFEQLKDRLIDCFEADKLTMNEELLHCIKYHQKLLQFCQKVKDISQLILLDEIVFVCYCVSLVLIKLTGTDADKYSHVPTMVICLCQLFLIHWTSELLANQSENLAFGVYMNLMKRLHDKKHVRNLHIMLTRAQNPVIITAGNFVTLSLKNYALILNRAFSFFMVLRSLGIQ